ncbi:hypothetical protein GLYMA_08G018050v4 [Glycine max]|nr:hypothetical protein GLYMA_08G018050v4 [Glycine max]KAH1049157.1 hypothetical protein GYH30_019955 [Glycine max]
MFFFLLFLHHPLYFASSQSLLDFGISLILKKFIYFSCLSILFFLSVDYNTLLYIVNILFIYHLRNFSFFIR